MPFTPFHCGPAALLKASIPRHFSFTVFTFAQVITDTEALYHLAFKDGPLHQHLHTYLGATGVAMFSLIAGRPVCQAALRWWRETPGLPLKEYYDPDPEISLVAAFTGAFLGTYSHVFLDSIMHPDVMPFAPWHTFNWQYGWLGPGTLHAICFTTGALGAWLCAKQPRGSQ